MKKYLLIIVGVLSLVSPAVAYQSDSWRTAEDVKNCPNPDSYWNPSTGHCHYRFNELYHYPVYQPASVTPNVDLYSIYNVPNDGSWYCGEKSKMPVPVCAPQPVCTQKPLPQLRQGNKVGVVQDMLWQLGYMKRPVKRGLLDAATKKAFQSFLESL